MYVFAYASTCKHIHMLAYASICKHIHTMIGCDCVLCLSGEEESLSADELPADHSESTVVPVASHGARGRDSGS